MTKQKAAVALAVVALIGLHGCHREPPVESKVGRDVKPGPALAQEKAKTSMLTSQEIAEGWISLFDGHTMSGWTGEANVADGALQLGNSQPLQYSTTFVSFELQFEYKVSGNKDQMVTLGLSPSEFIALHTDAASAGWHRAVIRSIREGPDIWSGSGRFFSDLLPETKPCDKFEQQPTKTRKSQNVIRFHTHTMNSLSLRNVKLKPLDQK